MAYAGDDDDDDNDGGDVSVATANAPLLLVPALPNVLVYDWRHPRARDVTCMAADDSKMDANASPRNPCVWPDDDGTSFDDAFHVPTCAAKSACPMPCPLSPTSTLYVFRPRSTVNVTVTSPAAASNAFATNSSHARCTAEIAIVARINVRSVVGNACSMAAFVFVG